MADESESAQAWVGGLGPFHVTGLRLDGGPLDEFPGMTVVPTAMAFTVEGRIDLPDDDPIWSCPGCGLRYDQVPEGHTWTYGGGGSCSDPEPASAAEFYERTRRQR